MHLSISIK